MAIAYITNWRSSLVVTNLNRECEVPSQPSSIKVAYRKWEIDYVVKSKVRPEAASAGEMRATPPFTERPKQRGSNGR